MDMQNYSEDERKRNLGLCMSAGIETPGDEDPSRFQRRHFPNKMTSNIFFSDSSLEDASRKNGNDFYASAGLDTRYNDQKQSGRRHFYSSENGTMRKEDEYQDEEEVDSSETAEPRNDNASEEIDNAANENEEEQVDSSGAAESVDEENDEQQQSEDGTMANDQGEKEEAASSGTTDSRETEEDGSDQKKTQRRHFGNKMNSNIFFSGLPIENMSLKDAADPTDFRKRKG